MNWFRQNRWLGTFLIVVGLLTIAGIYFLLSARGRSNEALEQFQQAVNEKRRLEGLDPFPSEANFKKMKLHLENYTAALNKQKEELKARVPSPPPLAPNEFQSKLRQAMLSVTEKARANKVKLPDNFALGFEEYTTALPTTTMAPLLGQELAQIEALVNILIDARVDGINTFKRRALADEKSGAASPTPSPSPRRPAAAAPVSPGAKMVERGTVDVSFSSAPSSMRRVLNQIVSSPQQFYVVRLLHVRNEKDKGPPREQTGTTTGTTATTQATPAKPAPNAALTFIVGNEHVETSARIEVLRFTF
ncbi:MAG TPA: Amuc_1100 family pilus-like protein [Chthoniobacterales bacterium]|nr:Amuc_1100 family pilus-like protein [Chthoniobacterales bacterium]